MGVTFLDCVGVVSSLITYLGLSGGEGGVEGGVLDGVRGPRHGVVVVDGA